MAASYVNTASAIHTSTKPVQRLAGMSSWYQTTPSRNCRIGAMYCSRPMVTIETRIAAAPKHSSGMMVTTPAVVSIQAWVAPWWPKSPVPCQASHATYGLSKKQAGVDAVESLTVETLFIGPFAAAYIAWLAWQGTGDFGHHGAGHAFLLTTAGVVTVIPLLCFGAAAIRVSMVTIGLLQYIAPILQFLLGVFWYGEAMPASRWVGFTLVWIALMVFTVDAVHHRRRQLRLSAEAVAL